MTMAEMEMIEDYFDKSSPTPANYKVKWYK